MIYTPIADLVGSVLCAVIPIDLSLLVRESLVGKVLDLLAAGVVKVGGPLHLGLGSGK